MLGDIYIRSIYIPYTMVDTAQKKRDRAIRGHARRKGKPQSQSGKKFAVDRGVVLARVVVGERLAVCVVVLRRGTRFTAFGRIWRYLGNSKAGV